MIDTEQIRNYIAGDSSQEEKEEMQLWLEADDKNRKEFMRLRMLYDITLCHLPEPDIKQKSNKSGHRKLWFDLLKVVAVILITFGCTCYFMTLIQLKQEKEELVMQTLHVPAGQRAELILSDGTKVWLNASTKFTFPSRFTAGEREVYLDGEAYFDVTHNAEKKFTVNTQEYAVNVLGTEFNVLAYSKSGKFEIDLLRGSVEIISKDYTQQLILSPGNKAYKEGSSLFCKAIQEHDHLLWKEGVISFDDERIEDILEQLELYYDIKIQNENRAIKDIRYTGKFRIKEGIEHALNVLQIPSGLQYTKNSEANVIQIK